ncbi:MAG: RHS repeat-associated core domain-containing protein [Akkermansia sp.]|nr:RHS repeat-associated core domain-containing protein [Akkermansia sp.]
MHGFDVTQWTYHLATGLELSKIYDDGTSEVRTYDAFNQLSSITDACDVMKSHSYDVVRGLLLSESYSDETNNRTYLYNFLAMPVQISDDAGVRNFAYNSFNEIDTEEQCKLSCFVYPYLWLITWDSTQPVATRSLAIQKDGTWYTYDWDLTKNICEIFGQNGYIRSTYAYTPFGSVTASGDVNQPIQWSIEYYDNELTLVYYNYRHYNTTDGRWINRDPVAEQGGWNLYGFVRNSIFLVDDLGKRPDGFYDLSLSIGALDPETLNKLKNVKAYGCHLAGKREFYYKGRKFYANPVNRKILCGNYI